MKFHSRVLALAAALAASVSALAAPETYTIDNVHSAVGFSIRHFVAKVPGNFAKFSGTIVVDRENPEKSSAQATIDAASINTGNQKRDDHLRGSDFFDVAKYPTITFKSTGWKKTGEDTFEVSGDLTIKDVTKPVTLNVTSLGFGPGAQPGSQLSGWEATTKIDKKEFNVKDPTMLDPALGDEVAIMINIEAKKS